MFRIRPIWVLGLIVSAIVGSLIGAALIEQGAGLGLIAGAALFIVARLILTMPR